MSKTLFFNLFIISIIYYINCERICEITQRKSPNPTRQCRQHSRYGKISENELVCEGICFVGQEPDSTKEIFLEFFGDKLTLVTVDERTRSQQIVYVDELDQYQVLKAHLDSSKIQILLESNNQKYVGFTDPRTGKTVLRKLGEARFNDAVLGDPITVIRARGPDLVKERLKKGDSRVDSYVIANFQKPLEGIKIKNDKITVEVDDEEKDIPLINCYMKEEVDREDICGGKLLKQNKDSEDEEDELPVVHPKTLPPPRDLNKKPKEQDQKSSMEEDKKEIQEPEESKIENSNPDQNQNEDEKSEDSPEVIDLSFEDSEAEIEEEKPKRLPTDDDMTVPYPADGTNKSPESKASDSSPSSAIRNSNSESSKKLTTKPSSVSPLLIFFLVVILIFVIAILWCTKGLYSNILRRTRNSPPPKIGEGSSYQPVSSSGDKQRAQVTLKPKRPNTLEV